jgi:hypothetical protein
LQHEATPVLRFFCAATGADADANVAAHKSVTANTLIVFIVRTSGGEESVKLSPGNDFTRL